VLAVLVVRSRFLFTASFYEQGDAGANSILIQQAMAVIATLKNSQIIAGSGP